MKTIKLTALVFFLSLFVFPFSATANDFKNHEDIHPAFGLQGWFTQADAKWRISFPYTTQFANPGVNVGTPGKIESELTFNKIDSPIFVFTAGSSIDKDFSFDLMYGTGSISGGRGTDVDRFLANSGGGVEFSGSQSDLDGDVKQWGFNFYFNNKRYSDNKRGPWGVVLGFLHYEDNLTMKNGVQTVPLNFEGLSQPAGPFSGLDSTYDFSWNMLKVGVLHQANLTKQLSFTGAFSFYPYVDYQGDGYWNLRAGTNPTDFRLQSPNFVQKSTRGYGYEASLGLMYAISENVELSAGYQYFYLYAENGTDTTYFADGSAVKSNLDWVTVTRHGTYAECVLRF